MAYELPTNPPSLKPAPNISHSPSLKIFQFQEKEEQIVKNVLAVTVLSMDVFWPRADFSYIHKGGNE